MKNSARTVLLLLLAAALVCPSVRAEDRLKLDFSAPTPGNAAVRSLAIPGWGQVFNGQRAKGASLFFATAASLAGSIILRSKSHDTLSDYHDKGLPNDPLYDDYKKQRQQSLLLEGAAVGFWLFAVVDAYLQARILPARDGLPGQHGPSFSVAPDGMAVAWRFGGEEP